MFNLKSMGIRPLAPGKIGAPVVPDIPIRKTAFRDHPGTGPGHTVCRENRTAGNLSVLKMQPDPQ
jgi:hypothetical protein